MAANKIFQYRSFTLFPYPESVLYSIYDILATFIPVIKATLLLFINVPFYKAQSRYEDFGEATEDPGRLPDAKSTRCDSKNVATNSKVCCMSDLEGWKPFLTKHSQVTVQDRPPIDTIEGYLHTLRKIVDILEQVMPPGNMAEVLRKEIKEVESVVHAIRQKIPFDSNRLLNTGAQRMRSLVCDVWCYRNGTWDTKEERLMTRTKYMQIKPDLTKWELVELMHDLGFHRIAGNWEICNCE